MKQRTFRKLVAISFCIGVNIIGLPVTHEHKGALYSIGTTKKNRQPVWHS